MSIYDWVMLSQSNTFINDKKYPVLPLYQGVLPSPTSARFCCPQSLYNELSIFLNSYSQCSINTYIYIVLYIFYRLDENICICHYIKMVQIRGMTIYSPMYLDPFFLKVY